MIPQAKQREVKKAGADMKRKFILPAITLCVFLVALGTTVRAQEYQTDTLQVVDATIQAGDTGAVFIYLVNSEILGGYSLRIRFDTAVLGVVTVPGDDSTAEATQLRGNFSLFGAGVPEAGVVSLLTAFPEDGPGMVKDPETGIVWGLDIGRGNTIQFRFYVHAGIAEGTTTDIVFEDAPFDTNAYNWFAHWQGLFQYRPIRVPGTITVGEGPTNNAPTISPVSSPVETFPGNLVSFGVAAQDQDGDPVTLTAYDLPSGAQFTPSNPVTGTGSVTGTFSWTPTSGQTGSFTVRFQANDNKGAYSAFTYVTINVSSGGAPTISPLTSPINTKQGSMVEFSVSAQDPEGEEVTLTAYNLPGGAEFTPSNPVTGIGTVSGLFRWTPTFQDSGLFTVQFQAEDVMNNTSAMVSVVIDVEKVQRDQLFTTSVEGQSPQGGVPGATGVLVPINFVNTVPVYGIQFDFVYDPTIFTVTDIVPTERLDGFSVYENIGETPGRIKVVTFSLVGDPIGMTGSLIFDVVGTISPSAPVGRYDLQFEDAWESINPDPNVPSKVLATVDGHLFVDILGDANLDTRIDVADVVSVVGSILGSFSFTERQFGAANVVVDATLDVYDLVGIINIIFGQPIQPAPYDFGGDVFARVEFRFDADEGYAGMYRLRASSPTEVAGIQAEVIYDPLRVKLVPPEPSALAAGLDMSYRDDGAGRMTVIMYYDPSDPATILPSGENEIFGMRIEPGPAGIEGELPPVKLRDVKLCTPEASKIHVEGYTDVPRTFELFQNYPNPFNPRTVIEFDLSPQDDGGGLVPTRLVVYNILGRKVATLLNAPLQPGRHAVEWLGVNDNGRPVGSGIYFYKLVAGEQSKTKKMVLLK